MPRPRKHIHRLYPPHLIPALTQGIQIPRQRLGVAGHVHDPLGSQLHETVQEFPTAPRSRRVGDDHVGALLAGGEIGDHQADRVVDGVVDRVNSGEPGGNVLKFEDLQEGMELTGTVRNVIDFGAFVDIGVHQDGLVHISQMTDKYIKHPLEAVSVGDIVEVKVMSVDLAKKRIQLTMKNI